MKSILLATDFSDAAKNAADFAAQLSKETGSILVVFHSWSLPVMSSETLAIPMDIPEIEKGIEAALLTEVERIEKTWAVKAASAHAMGFAAEEIALACKQHGSAIAVVGMRHHNMVGQLLGSVATAFIHQNIVPVLVIPEQVPYTLPKTLLLATDLQTNSDWHEIDVLKEISEKLKAGIHILNVRENDQAASGSESKAGIRLEARMKNVVHNWHFQGDGSIEHAISSTADQTKADWVVLVPHRLPWVKQLFHTSVTNKVAFSTTRPLLALPERHVALSS